MQLLEHYARLFGSLTQKQHYPAGPAETTVTIAEIAACLFCTERNAKLLIKTMREHGWIAWSAGRGRGNRSRLTLLVDPGELLLGQAVELLANNRVQEAVALLDTEWLSGPWRERLLQTLRQSFGYVRTSGGNAARQLDLLRFPSYRNPGSLDPALTTRRTELHFIRQLFDTLVEYDSVQDQLVPGLAHHWETDGHAKCWRFYLQKHVRFHNETPFTAEDVKYSLDRLREPSLLSPYRMLYRHIQHVKVIDEFSVDIEMSTSGLWHLPSLLASSAASVIQRGQSGSEWAYTPSGTGPFKLAHRDERLFVLEANPFYFRRAANVDRIEMWCLPEVYEEQFARFSEVGLEGEGMNFRHYGSMESAQEFWELTVSTDRGCKYVLLNRAKGGLLEQPSLRSTLRKVIRECDAAGRLGGNRGELADGFIRGLSLEDRNEISAADGNSIVSSSSPAAEQQPLQLVTYAGAGHERDAAWLQQALADYNIPLAVRLVPYEALGDPEVLAQADLLLLEQPVDTDAEWTMRAILGSGQSPLRRCLPADRLRELDRRLAELTNEPSRGQRLRALVRLERELLEQTVILWYRWRQSASFPPELRGVQISSFGWVDYKRLWFAR